MKPLHSKKLKTVKSKGVEYSESIKSLRPPSSNLMDEIDYSKPWDFTGGDGQYGQGFLSEIHSDSMVSCFCCANKFQLKNGSFREHSENIRDYASNEFRDDITDVALCPEHSWKTELPKALWQANLLSEFEVFVKGSSIHINHQETNMEVRFPIPADREFTISDDPSSKALSPYVIITAENTSESATLHINKENISLSVPISVEHVEWFKANFST